MGKVVLALLLLLAIASVVPSTRAKMAEQKTALVDKVKVRLVPARLRAMGDQLDTRLGRGESMPQPFEVWLMRSFSGEPQDPWGTVYYLQMGRRNTYTVGSAGPDRQPNTADDITLERSLPGGR